jgi:hypothetical protein
MGSTASGSKPGAREQSHERRRGTGPARRRPTSLYCAGPVVRRSAGMSGTIHAPATRVPPQIAGARAIRRTRKSACGAFFRTTARGFVTQCGRETSEDRGATISPSPMQAQSWTWRLSGRGGRLAAVRRAVLSRAIRTGAIRQERPQARRSGACRSQRAGSGSFAPFIAAWVASRPGRGRHSLARHDLSTSRWTQPPAPHGFHPEAGPGCRGRRQAGRGAGCHQGAGDPAIVRRRSDNAVRGWYRYCPVRTPCARGYGRRAPVVGPRPQDPGRRLVLSPPGHRSRRGDRRPLCRFLA